MDAVLLDTNILSEVLRGRNPVVQQHARQYLRSHGQFALSAVTRFEIIRGYKEQNASTQLTRFFTFCGHSLVLPVTDDIFDRAADLWVEARRGGHPCADADLLIAATAIEHRRSLVTSNVGHFHWMTTLAVDDWRKP
ncbi:MAG: type II toxin-antitoxin system VapC family toxin [Planctomycetia bacterium]|nr:type II toxin-antitoxin system VapC family toxin [Planctomycetia bacterium]